MCVADGAKRANKNRIKEKERKTKNSFIRGRN